MKITKGWLKKINACREGVDEFDKYDLSTPIKCVEKCIKINRLDWANWLIVRCMEYKQYVSYAIFAAEQVIDIYEKRYPNDIRPRNAINAAKKCLNDPSIKNKKSAYAADAAAYAAYAAYAADAAAYAAAAAADAAASAAYAADADAAAAHAAYAAAHTAYAAARIKTLKKCAEIVRKDYPKIRMI